MADHLDVRVPCWYGQEISSKEMPVGAGRLFQGIRTGNSVCVAFYVDKRDADKLVGRNKELELVQITKYSQLRKLLTDLQAEGATEIAVVQGNRWQAHEINQAIIAAALADD